MRSLLLILCLVLSVSLLAQEAAKAPVLTEAQALQLKTSIQRIEIAQLKLQLLQVEQRQAMDAAQALIKTLQVDGYDLDLDKLAYVPKPK